MGLIKIFFTLIVMAILLWFLALNVGQTIQQLHIFSTTLYNVNLVHVLLATFLIGIFVGFLIPVFQVLQAKAEARQYERETRKLKQELNDLRNVAIEEDITMIPEETSAGEKQNNPE